MLDVQPEMKIRSPPGHLHHEPPLGLSKESVSKILIGNRFHLNYASSVLIQIECS